MLIDKSLKHHIAKIIQNDDLDQKINELKNKTLKFEEIKIIFLVFINQ